MKKDARVFVAGHRGLVGSATAPPSSPAASLTSPTTSFMLSGLVSIFAQ